MYERRNNRGIREAKELVGQAFTWIDKTRMVVRASQRNLGSF